MVDEADISRLITAVLFDETGAPRQSMGAFEHRIQECLPSGWTYVEWRLPWRKLKDVPNYNDLEF